MKGLHDRPVGSAFLLCGFACGFPPFGDTAVVDAGAGTFAFIRGRGRNLVAKARGAAVGRDDFRPFRLPGDRDRQAAGHAQGTCRRISTTESVRLAKVVYRQADAFQSRRRPTRCMRRLYTAPWLRLLGARLAAGRRSRRSRILTPICCAWAGESFVADLALVGAARYYQRPHLPGYDRAWRPPLRRQRRPGPRRHPSCRTAA